MKKLLTILLISMFMFGNAYGADISDWVRGDGSDVVEGDESISDLDDTITNYMQDPLDKLLTEYIHGCTLTITDTETVTVSAGEVTCYNSARTIKRMRRNTSTATMEMDHAAGVGGIDSGSAERASTWYDIYAVADADATTFTIISTEQGTAPSDVTYYRYIGSAYNDAGQDLDTYYWSGEGATITVIWDVPINEANGVVGNNWTAVDCASSIPSSSTLGTFGVYSSDGNTNTTVWIRPTGSNWTTDVENGAHLSVSDNPTQGHAQQRWCMTDSSQSIDYYDDGGQDAVKIEVEGFVLTR